MAVAIMEIAHRQQALDPLFPGLADADQEAGGEGNLRLARRRDRRKADRRALVGRSEMRAALLAEPLRTAFEHQPHRSGERAEALIIVGGEDAGVDMRHDPCLGDRTLGDMRKIVDCRCEAHALEIVARGGVAKLGLIAVGEEQLLASGGDTGAGDLDHLFGGHIGSGQPAGRLGEGAIVADVAA